MQYRADIDGLRAVAVLAVVFYHLMPDRVSGGFIGVDIFFVISGYLITLIISRDRDKANFSFANFYARRIKRLLPALWPVVLYTTIVAALVFNDEQYSSYIESLLSSFVFLSNHYFSSTFNYFNTANYSTLLLHFWSLSVEEQFYLFWPAFLIFLLYLPLSAAKKLSSLLALSFLSFVGATLMAGTGQFANDAFYLLPPRAGEFLLGCALGLYQHFYRRELNLPLLSELGFCLILVCIIQFDSETTFPGANALWPCLGAILIISQRPEQSFLNRQILGSRPMVYIGKISYSLYLWHWPVIALPKYLFAVQNLSILFALFGISIVLSHLSWSYIEKPFRKSNYNLKQSLLYFYSLPILVVISVNFVVRDQIPKSGEIFTKTSYTERHQPFCYSDYAPGKCRIGADTPIQPTAVLFGDSHAGHYAPFWHELGKEFNFSIEALSAQTCYPLVSFNGKTPSDDSIKDTYNCPKHIELTSQLVNNFDTLVLAGAWNIYLEGPRSPKSFDFLNYLEVQLKHFKSLDKKVVLMSQVPWYAAGDVSRYQNVHSIPYEPIRSLVQSYSAPLEFQSLQSVDNANAVIKSLALKYENVVFLEAWPAGTQEPFIEGRLTHANSDHLTPKGSIELAKRLPPKSKAAIKEVFNLREDVKN